jgi:hypothetical protein
MSARAESGALPYGVPDGDTTFTYEQRDLLTWVNAARVDPAGWDDFIYWASPVRCSSTDFTSAELAPKPPLSHDVALEKAAMDYSRTVDNGDTPDPAGDYERLFASLYDTGFSTTFNGWVCDTVARAVLMDAAHAEAGAGASSNFYTLAVAESDGFDTDSPVVNASQMIDFSRANGNPWYFVAPAPGSTGGC